jgi:hypothetical protein
VSADLCFLLPLPPVIALQVEPIGDPVEVLREVGQDTADDDLSATNLLAWIGVVGTVLVLVIWRMRRKAPPG